MISSTKAARLFLLLVLIQVVHSSEEIFYKLFEWQPVLKKFLLALTGRHFQFEMTEEVFAILNIAVITFLFLVCISLYRYRPWAYKLVTGIAFVELLNGLIHLSSTITLREYLPGTVSAIVLAVVSSLFLLNRLRNYRKIHKAKIIPVT
jgi:hypothetical protein